MVHAVHRSIQVYQDFHRQTLSHLQKLEQNCYKLMPQFDPEQVLGMVEQAHRMKAGARYLNLTGFEKLSFHVKGRYMGLLGQSLAFDQDLLKQLIQMKELFRLCLLSNIATWQADLSSVMAKLPDVFQTLDQGLTLHPQFSQNFPSQTELETDIQRLLVAIVLIPELARLDMMLKNTPASKLCELLTSQLPRLQDLAQRLQLHEIQRSMQMSLLEIQARPSHAKTIGLQSLLKWSDLANQTLNRQSLRVEPSLNDWTSFELACVTEFESALTNCAVVLIEGSEEEAHQALQTHAKSILELANTFEIGSLKSTTQTVLSALKYHASQSKLIGRLAVQAWLRHQLHGVVQNAELENFPISEVLQDMSQPPEIGESSSDSHSQDPTVISLLSQVEMPDGFREFTSEDEQSISIYRADLDKLRTSLQQYQQELTSTSSPELQQTFQTVLEDYHNLVSIPLFKVFDRLQPMVDALELQNETAVSLKFSGDQIAIDRCKAETVHKLLVPLISHAVVHGLEKPQERQRLGKSFKGRLSIAAYPQNDDVVIELRDDGRGINFEILREWVIRRYGLAPQEGNFLTEPEILDFVFKGGDTVIETEETAEESGLGVIQEVLDQLKGSIEVATVMTQGTTFRLHLPKLIIPSLDVLVDKVAASPANSLTYQSNATDYSLDALRHQGQVGPTLQLETKGLFIWADSMSILLLECDRIEEYVMPHVTKAHKTQTSLTWRDQVIPIFSLQDFLGHSSSEDAHIDDDVILLLKGEQQHLALRAPMHHLVNVPMLNINPLSQALAAPRYIYGTAILGQEAPRLVVDVAALIAQQPVQALFPLPSPSEDSPPPSEQAAPVASDGVQIMVVDDSRTAREIVSLTLRQGGYEVIHAKDGVDALEQLKQQQLSKTLVDLVISDVAMPRMNGLEFLRQCRQDKAFESLPIAMLSNCDSATHSDLALKEGASAYLTKPYKEEVFLAEIARLLEMKPQAVVPS